jgi:hypothetical protein
MSVRRGESPTVEREHQASMSPNQRPPAAHLSDLATLVVATENADAIGVADLAV